ncbi:MAG: hypothetical protein L0Y66_21515 [Myxococcaceae bacterium]|nr:hypothetical protein [Myxococcaceae bacterium]
MGRSKGSGEELTRQFEGSALLDDLLALAGSRYDTDGVVVAFRAALKEGHEAREAIPTLFDGEPHFPSPEIARRLYGNLFGLWDVLAEGGPLTLEAPPPREPRHKPEKTPPPSPFGPEGPGEAFVEQAWRHLEDDERSRTRLLHAFENRQDGLLEALDVAGLSDEGYGVARFLLFELHAFLELGRPGKGLPRVDSRALEAEPPEGTALPPALVAYAEEALFEAEQDEEAPLSAAELPRVRTLVMRGLGALWSAFTTGA